MSKSNDIVTLLAFDYGTKNIGLAVGQTLTLTATSLPHLAAYDGKPDIQKLTLLVEEWQPDAFIIGMPLNMDSSESIMSLRAKKFANRMRERFNKLWYPVDERLSTYEAKLWVQQSGRKKNSSKQPVDSMVAKILLENWMSDPKNVKILTANR